MHAGNENAGIDIWGIMALFWPSLDIFTLNAPRIPFPIEEFSPLCRGLCLAPTADKHHSFPVMEWNMEC